MTKSFRVIAKIDIKSSDVIMGINFEGMRKVGNGKKMAKKYFKEGADELIINDVNASLFGRSTALNFLKECSKEIFIPVTLAGGLKNIEDVHKALINGADKVEINTAAVKDKSIISKISKVFGSQALVVSINAKKISSNKWMVYIDKGREKTGLEVMKWAKFVEQSGAGEIHINSIDKDGTHQGFDLDLIKKISRVIKIPLVVGGGLGEVNHIDKLMKIKNIEGLSASSALHYNTLTISQIKNTIIRANKEVRI